MDAITTARLVAVSLKRYAEACVKDEARTLDLDPLCVCEHPRSLHLEDAHF
jgi:hypothetical protein